MYTHREFYLNEEKALCEQPLSLSFSKNINQEVSSLLEEVTYIDLPYNFLNYYAQFFSSLCFFLLLMGESARAASSTWWWLVCKTQLANNFSRLLPLFCCPGAVYVRLFSCATKPESIYSIDSSKSYFAKRSHRDSPLGMEGIRFQLGFLAKIARALAAPCTYT